MTAPARYKLALLSWMGAYAVITLILYVLGPAPAPWPLPVRTLVISALMAPAMVYLVMPVLTRLFKGWLVPSAKASAPAPRREVERQHAPAGRVLDVAA
jgi:antibiotic biosynthesis monooxygenase (ABM) superfamily enzyme